MSNLKLCPKGHFYPRNLDSCPYCQPSKTSPVVANPVSTKKTQVGHNLKHTSVKSTKHGLLHETKILPHPEKLVKKHIHEPEVERKLYGWIVTFDLDPKGMDFKLLTGVNMIGSASGCSIAIEGDSFISASHCIIDCHDGKVKILDQMSLNGTFLNSHRIKEHHLKDGDVIMIGKTNFILKLIH